jgi:hypothetical protein
VGWRLHGDLGGLRRGWHHHASAEAVMVEKYRPDSIAPVTDYEREILEIMQEEAAELIVAVSKLLRFGKKNTNPSTGETSTVELGLEMGDLSFMMGLVQDHNLIDFATFMRGRQRKAFKLKMYLQTSPP